MDNRTDNVGIPKTEREANFSLADRERVRQRKRDQEMLVICVAVLVLSFLLQSQPGDHVGISFLKGLQLPPLCMSKELFGISCPGCGLTRSFVHLAHGDVSASINSHRLGPLLALLVAIQIPYRLWSLYVSEKKWPSLRACNLIGNLIIASLIINWLISAVLS